MSWYDPRDWFRAAAPSGGVIQDQRRNQWPSNEGGGGGPFGSNPANGPDHNGRVQGADTSTIAAQQAAEANRQRYASAVSLGNGLGNGAPGSADEQEQRRKALLYQQAQAAGGFAQQAQRDYRINTDNGQQALGYLQRTANGENSVSAMQLQQGLQQNLAAQQSLAAGAAPQNSAMAARTAAIQSGRLGSGLAGQQAAAGLQERSQAQGQYGALITGLRGQDAQVADTARANALTGYGANNAGAPDQSWWDKHGNQVIAAGATAAAAYAASDRRLKTGIRDGTGAAESALKGLSAHSFKYKDDSLGRGRRVGVMAQDLEKAGLGHAVVNTPRGKMVHGAQLATSLSAMMPGLDARLRKLEGGKR